MASRSTLSSLLLLLCTFLLPVGAANADSGSAALFSRESRDLARDIAVAASHGKQLVVLFETADCGYCATMRRQVFGRRAVREAYRRHYDTVSVHVDDGRPLLGPRGLLVAPLELARELGIVGTPGFAFFDQGGALLARYQGALEQPAEFNQLARYVAAGAYESQSFASWLIQNDLGYHSAQVAQAPALDFAYTDPTGRQRHLAELRGRVVLLAFGYTQCPDVCPTTLAEVREILQRLGPDAERIRPIFISVDGERDTLAVLGAYAAAFDSRIAAGVIAPRQIRRLAQSAGLVARRQASGSGYSVDHSAGFFILDQGGRLRLRSDYGQDIATVIADLRRLLVAKRSTRPS